MNIYFKLWIIWSGSTVQKFVDRAMQDLYNDWGSKTQNIQHVAVNCIPEQL